MSKETKVVDIKDAKIEEIKEPVKDQEANTSEEVIVPEVKHTVFGKIDKKIVARREAKAKKKAEKKPVDKAKKAAIIGGGVALGLGILGAVGKAALNAAAKCSDDDQDAEAETSDYDYPSEDVPEEAEVEVDQATETTENEET